MEEHQTIKIKEISDDQFQRMNKHFSPKKEDNIRKSNENQHQKPQRRKFKPAKSTKAQELKEFATRKKLDNLELQQKTEELQVKLRQENIEREKERISPTIKRSRCLDTNIGLLIRRDRIKSTERVYNEWLVLKRQEIELRQSLLSRIVGDMTTFSIEREMTALQRAEKEAAQKAAEEGNQQGDIAPNV
ncbi:hypothetical protein TVAG_321820 [Trichomonas vaginalis G3]|uniref:Uncharacterized protein n=1 Tax=Trichomonas vaginalis (strain ATCC PRA-98 / G3) TaxID=412133 RepID=A2FQG0_TRIV3|nr:hypothetical protein TVAGG3_0482070 [Trichomonas vaginalis G3]EAX92868.1 hypothetical protein TVAG_321820 [Trichomonas vaginalis G3]KAI5515779.1 hypothetical protein TVAGG3_0482070 [Trichomonas vaginalis G3]|eukprot:XP_001305798.1 hypothetical protein [Trichomonas vaginalis G3]